MKKTLLIWLFYFWAIPQSTAQLKTYSFEAAEILSKEHPKPLLIFIHTSWCNYCRMMEHSTFKDPNVVKIINEDYYFISFDAQEKRDILFNKQLYNFMATGPNTGIHQLAVSLGTIRGQLSYPSLCILDNNYSTVFQSSSYINSNDLFRILQKTK